MIGLVFCVVMVVEEFWRGWFEDRVKREIARSYVVDVGAGVALDPGELVLRTDGVRVWASRELRGLAGLTVTDRRLIFAAPPVPRHYKWAYRSSCFHKSASRLPVLLGQTFSIPLSDIVGYRKWRPEFSGSPVVKTTSGNCAITLLDPKLRRASREAVRAHFKVIEDARDAAKAEAQPASTSEVHALPSLKL